MNWLRKEQSVFVAAWQCALPVNAMFLNEVELPEMGDDEEAMLSEAFFVKPNSRLGCQIQITEDLEGLELELAPEY